MNDLSSEAPRRNPKRRCSKEPIYVEIKTDDEDEYVESNTVDIFENRRAISSEDDDTSESDDDEDALSNISIVDDDEKNDKPDELYTPGSTSDEDSGSDSSEYSDGSSDHALDYRNCEIEEVWRRLETVELSPSESESYIKSR
jgi:hypothetical protein